MTGPAPTIRRMKIEDYPLVYGLWTRCTGFTMRDIDDSEDAIKTFLKRNPDTCFVAEDDGGRIIGAILAGHDSRRSRIYHTAVDPDARGMGIGSLLVGRVVEAACQKSPSVCPQTTMPATISGSIRGLLSVTIWSIGNYLSNTTRPTTNRPIRSHFVSISPVPHLQSATNMFCISNVFKDHAVEYQTEEDPFGALKRDELL